jgi:hypothetical protein
MGGELEASRWVDVERRLGHVWHMGVEAGRKDEPMEACVQMGQAAEIFMYSEGMCRCLSVCRCVFICVFMWMCGWDFR